MSDIIFRSTREKSFSPKNELVGARTIFAPYSKYCLNDRLSKTIASCHIVFPLIFRIWLRWIWGVVSDSVILCLMYRIRRMRSSHCTTVMYGMCCLLSTYCFCTMCSVHSMDNMRGAYCFYMAVCKVSAVQYST